MNKKYLLISILIFIESSIIVSILYNLLQNHIAIYTAPIDKKTLIFSPESPIKNFYEPKENTIIINRPKYFTLPYSPSYTINKDSLNERYNYTIQKPKDTIRIITLGDSYTFGYFVNTKDNWTEQLEEMLQTNCNNHEKYEVINLAERGYDISYSVERFRKRGIKYNADIVLWLIKYDDFDEIKDIVDPLSKKYEEELKKDTIMKEAYKKGVFFPYSVKAKEEFHAMYAGKKILDAQKTFLTNFTTYYKNNLLFIPLNLSKEQLQVLKTFASHRPKTSISSYLPSFQKLPDQHPSKEGHKTIAKNVFTYLQEGNIIACNETLPNEKK